MMLHQDTNDFSKMMLFLVHFDFELFSVLLNLTFLQGFHCTFRGSKVCNLFLTKIIDLTSNLFVRIDKTVAKSRINRRDLNWQIFLIFLTILKKHATMKPVLYT